MANKILLKKSSEAAKVPQASVLEPAELAINLSDKVLYSKDTANSVFLIKADPLYNTGLQDNLDAKVDIAGDTMTGDLVVQGTVTTDHLQFNTAANNAIDIGEIYWNSLERTYNVGFGNDVVGQGFQEVYHPLVKNNTANTISNGTVVGLTGVESGYVTVAPFISDGSFSHPTKYWGVATEDITPDSTGFVTHFGKVRGIDTSSWSAGDILYASDSAEGMLTNVMPSTPSDIIIVGVVIESANSGVIEVRHEFSDRATDVPYANTNSNLIATNVKTALDELDMKKASIEMLTSSINLYPTSNTGDFGYYKLVSDLDDPAYDDVAYDFQTGAITTTDQYIAGAIADANLFVGNPGVISITTIGNIAKIFGNSMQYAEFYFRLYKRDAGGTETLLFTSSATGAVNGTTGTYRQFSATGLLNDGVFLDTDRLVIKYYANLLGVSGPTYQFQFGGTNPVRTLVPVPISVIPAYTADSILVTTDNFNYILSSADSDVQQALETIDDIVAPKNNPILNNPTYTGTLTGSSSVLNIGSGQLYKAANGFIGIGTSTPTHLLEVVGGVIQVGNGTTNTIISNTSITINGANVWHSSNDGSGSGLDADLLDGQHGSYYTANTLFAAHTANTSNPHSVTATQVGLGNVTNESKAVMFTDSVFTGNTALPNTTTVGGIDINTLVGGFASGTAMIFAQTSAPTGWTKSLSHNDKALRVVSGTAGSGGSAAFSSVFTSRTPSGSVSVSGTVDATTLTTAQIPSHTHNFQFTLSDSAADWGFPIRGKTYGYTAPSATFTTQTSGGGGSHTHGFSGGGSFTGSAMDFAVQYVDVIIATKD